MDPICYPILVHRQHTHTTNGKLCAPPAELPGPGLGRADLPPLPPAAAALGPEEPDAEAEGRGGGQLGPAAHPPRPPHTLPDQGGAGGGCGLRGRGDILTSSYLFY